MKTIAHIIHPVIVDESSDLVIAQPITFETMNRAAGYSDGIADVSLYAVQYHDEARVPLPGRFIRTPDLRRCAADIKAFKKRKKLALIGDILDTLYEASRADYFIYTNVDIALQPYFYQAVSRIIDLGYDAFVINRRTISDTYTTVEEIPLMYAEVGEFHKGYDCFVFKRDLYPKFNLGDICIGTAWIGRTLLANMVYYGSQFKEFRNHHFTFHIGDPCPWRKEEYNDYFHHNKEQYVTIFNRLESQLGPLEPVWRSYLVDTGDQRQIPTFEEEEVPEASGVPKVPKVR